MKMLIKRELWIALLFISMVAATIFIQRYQNRKIQLYKSGVLVYHHSHMRGEKDV